ncbi:MAG: efflux RND transporter permease subunit [Planctomycetota bacterium]
MTTLFYRNPRLLIVFIALLVVAGLGALSTLPRAEDPRIPNTAATVIVQLPGADAERVEALVSEPIERELLEIDEVREVVTVSKAGVSVISIELEDAVEKGQEPEVWSRVRDRLGDAEALLPPEASQPTFDNDRMFAFTMIAAVVWESDAPVSRAVLNRLAEDLEDGLRALPGTEYTDRFGVAEEEVRVEVDPAKLAALGFSAADLADAVRVSDAKVAAGLLRSGANDLQLEVEGEVDSLERVRDVTLKLGGDGQAVRLGDVATVTKTVADPPERLALIGGRPGVAVGARLAVDYRVDRWSAAANRVVEQMDAGRAPGVDIRVLFDQRPYMDARLNGLVVNFLMGVGLVMLVIWLTMGLGSALVVGMSLPLTATMVLVLMGYMGVPIHQMSITGLIIALGLLIDNAIVVTDEVRRRLAKGAERVEAVSRAVKHLAVPLLGSTLTTVFAFAPIYLMPGGAGGFVGTIALGVILALLSSFALSMTVIPTLAARFGSQNPAKESWWRSGLESEWLARRYESVLGWLLARPMMTIAVVMLIPLVGFVKAGTLIEQFFPGADRDMFQIQLHLPADAPIEKTAEAVRVAREVLADEPRITGSDWFMGARAPLFYYNLSGGVDDSPNFAQGMIKLDNFRDQLPVLNRVQRELEAALPGVTVLTIQLEQGPPFDAPIEVELRGPDTATLADLAEAVRRELSEIPGVIGTTTTQEVVRPMLRVTLDEQAARLAGLDNRGVAEQLEAALSGATGGSLLEGTKELPVRVRLTAASRSGAEGLASIDLYSPTIGIDGDETDFAAEGVPLAAVGSLDLIPEPGTIERINGVRTNRVYGFVEPGLLPSIPNEAWNARLAAGAIDVPSGYEIVEGGQAGERDRAVGNLMANVAVLGVLMAATLVLSFGSFRLAAVIGVVGLAAVGFGLLSLWVFRFPFGFMAIVGTMGLIGVAINDTIVVLAALRADPDARAGDVAAVRRVVVDATRHVMSTTLTTVAGFLPLIIAGGGFWPPLVVAIAGGVVGASLLSLTVGPSAFLLLYGQREKPTAAEPDSAPVAAVREGSAGFALPS